MEIRELIVRYGVVVGRRFYNREKLRFLSGALKEFTDLGMPVAVKEGEKTKRKAYNMYVGDVKNANIVVSAYYDTPPKTFNLVKHHVFSPSNDKTAFMAAIVVPTFIIAVLAAWGYKFVIQPAWADGIFNLYDILSVLIVVLLGFLMGKYRNGAANAHNLVRNTSGIIGAIKLAEYMTADEKKKTALALTDYGCINHFGDEMLKVEMGEGFEEKYVVFLDCIGGNAPLTIVYRKQALPLIDKIRGKASTLNIRILEIDESDKNYYDIFQKSILITSGEIKKGYILAEKTNTSQDDTINEENITLTAEILKCMINKGV